MTDSVLDPRSLRLLLTEQSERFAALDRGHPREALRTAGAALKTPHVIAITGLRRAGKSTLQAQLADACFPNDFHYVNFDDERWAGFEASKFNLVHETLLELFGEKKHFLLDEVQNIPGWEMFVRRLHDAGHKVVLTGSNASLLSRELGTRLTGRHVSIELFPFSFGEYLGFKGIKPLPKTTAETARLKRAFRDYLHSGGVPDALKFPDARYCAQLYQDILYRDIAARYSLDSLRSLREASLFLLTNVGRPISFNKLKQQLMLGSVNTVKAYVEYLEASWLLFSVNCFSPSVKQQQIAPKKVYCVDNGIVREMAFRTSEDTGWLLENLVFLRLRRLTPEIFYAKNEDGSEVDFLTRKGSKPDRLIQVCASLRAEATRKRELTSLARAMKNHSLREGTVVTLDEEEEIREGRNVIHVVPAREWCRKLEATP